MRKDYIIQTHKTWYRSFSERYPALTEEADMPIRELLQYYNYNQVINRREIPYLPCELEPGTDNSIKVYSRYSKGREYIGTVKKVWSDSDPFVICATKRIRVDGGQKIKVVEGERRDKIVRCDTGYTFILEMSVRDQVMNETLKSIF